MAKITITHQIRSKFLAQKLGVSEERARQLIKKVKLKLGCGYIVIGDYLEHADRPIPNKETWFD